MKQLKSVNIQKPTPILDLNIVRSNLERMVAKVQGTATKLRPHMKTHQSLTIAEMLHDYSIDKITVSSVEMAAYFALNGWGDITIAVPANPLEISHINEVAAETSLSLLVDNQETLMQLESRLNKKVGIWIKIDVGYHRAGISAESIDEIAALAKSISSSKKVLLRGILTHAGHSYDATGADEILAIHTDSLKKMASIRQSLAETINEDIQISIGDTPTCSLANFFEPADEIRPGNFFFFDLFQHQLGVCELSDIALRVACPVIGKYPDRETLAIYGGGIHLSKECLYDHQQKKIFGMVDTDKPNEMSLHCHTGRLYHTSQEHGLISLPAAKIEATRIGDIMLIFPVHSCMTAEQYGYYLTTDGNRISRMRL